MQDIADQDARRDRSIKLKLALVMLATILALAVSATVSARNADRLAEEQQAIAEQVRADHAPLNEVRHEYVGLLRAVGQFARSEAPDADEAARVQLQHERLAQGLKQFRSGSADDDFRSQLSAEARLAISAASDTLEGALDLLGTGQYAQARGMLRNGTDALLSVLIVMDQRLIVGEQSFGAALAQVDALEDKLERSGWLLAIAVLAVLLGFAAGHLRPVRPQLALRSAAGPTRIAARDSLVLAEPQGNEQREPALSPAPPRPASPEFVLGGCAAPENGQTLALDVSVTPHSDAADREREALLNSLCPVDGLHTYEDLSPLAALDELHATAVQDFVAVHRDTEETLRDALDGRDLDAAMRLANALAIKAEMIGASELATVGRDIERALAARDLTAAKRSTTRIKAPMRRLVRVLAKDRSPA